MRSSSRARAAEAIQGLAEVVEGSAAAGRVIAERAHEQRLALDQIVAGMSELSAAAAGTASGAAEIEAAASALASRAPYS